jgi:hypothetical protein
MVAENCLFKKMDTKERKQKGKGTIRNQVPYDMASGRPAPPNPIVGFNALQLWPSWLIAQDPSRASTRWSTKPW